MLLENNSLLKIFLVQPKRGFICLYLHFFNQTRLLILTKDAHWQPQMSKGAQATGELEIWKKKRRGERLNTNTPNPVILDKTQAHNQDARDRHAYH